MYEYIVRYKRGVIKILIVLVCFVCYTYSIDRIYSYVYSCFIVGFDWKSLNNIPGRTADI